jgi:hypothetical protein
LSPLHGGITPDPNVWQADDDGSQAPGYREFVFARPDHSLVGAVGLKLVGLDCVRLLEEALEVLSRRPQTMMVDKEGLTVYCLLTKSLRVYGRGGPVKHVPQASYLEAGRMLVGCRVGCRAES